MSQPRFSSSRAAQSCRCPSVSIQGGIEPSRTASGAGSGFVSTGGSAIAGRGDRAASVRGSADCRGWGSGDGVGAGAGVTSCRFVEETESPSGSFFCLRCFCLDETTSSDSGAIFCTRRWGQFFAPIMGAIFCTHGIPDPEFIQGFRDSPFPANGLHNLVEIVAFRIEHGTVLIHSPQEQETDAELPPGPLHHRSDVPLPLQRSKDVFRVRSSRPIRVAISLVPWNG